VLSASFIFFAAASPASDTQSLAAKRQQAEIISILTPLSVSAPAAATDIVTLVTLGADEADITAAFGKLTGLINDATTQIAAIAPTTTKRQTDDGVATALAGILEDVANILDQVVDIPLIKSLLPGLDGALNNLLKAVEVLLADVLTLVAVLLKDVAALLQELALGLTLASLGL